MTESCFNCFYLNREQKEVTEHGSIQYGCDSNGRFGFVPFTVRSDNELKTGGCSDWCGNGTILRQGQLFRFFTGTNKYVCQYCGKIGNLYIIWNQTLQVYKEVKQGWFKANIQNIQLIKDVNTEHVTAEEKRTFRKRMAQARKKKYKHEKRNK